MPKKTRLNTVGGLIKQFQKEVATINELAQVTLKGHLIIEQEITAIIENFFFHPKYVEDCQLPFFKKVKLAQGFSMVTHDDSVWDLVYAINTLRNESVHSLNSPNLKQKLKKVKQLYFQEIKNMPNTDWQKDRPDHEIVSFACSFCIGFLHAYKQDALTHRRLLDSMSE